jgi:hypothetical protein
VIANRLAPNLPNQALGVEVLRAIGNDPAVLFRREARQLRFALPADAVDATPNAGNLVERSIREFHSVDYFVPTDDAHLLTLDDQNAWGDAKCISEFLEDRKRNLGGLLLLEADDRRPADSRASG